MAANHKMTLGGMPLRVNPEEIHWNFSMKMTDSKAVGGKVIQILGTKISDITVRGRYSPDRSKGDREAWEQQVRFRERIKEMAREIEGAPGDRAQPIRLTYPPRGWDFDVFIVSLSPVRLSPNEVAPAWDLVLFPVGDGVRAVVEKIEALYLERLMDGVGWKQSQYNGPSEVEVDELLSGRTVSQYLGDRTREEHDGGGDSSRPSARGGEPW